MTIEIVFYNKYIYKYKTLLVNSDILNKDNVNKDSERSENTSNRPKREAAIIGELKHKYTNDTK